MPRLTFDPPSLVAAFGLSAAVAYATVTVLQAAGPESQDQATSRSGANNPWRLPQADVATTSSIGSPVPKGRPASEGPEGRRIVRTVYPGLTDAR